MSTNIEAKVLRLIEQGPGFPLQPTGENRSTYLDLAERLVRVAATWQDEQGAMIDPVAKEELGQSSPRFISSGAILLQFGRIDDLREQIYRGMDWCCYRLAAGLAKSSDFWMREIMTAWLALKDEAVPPQRRAQWEKHLCSIDPESIYWQVSPDGSKLKDLYNWTVYAAAGEGLRQITGLGPTEEKQTVVWGAKFFEKYIPPQLSHFSPEGMYRDPGDPFTYDMTTRLQFATPLAFGLETPLRPAIDDLLCRGALAQLLYVSPEGFAPFGGRSNQFHLQEAILAALGELEAKRYKQSNPKLAGAFKRQAHLGVAAVRRWLVDMQPHRHLKNGFAPNAMHGCEDYAGYAVYSLFTASCLGLAVLFADESIAEAPMPAEIGGYVLELAPAFHKVFAVCGKTQIEIDTCADPHYDATGLGRFHRAGVPLELGLSTPFPVTPDYRIPAQWKSAGALAIGPQWLNSKGKWVSLAGMHEGLTSQLTIEQETAEAVVLRIVWQHTDSQTWIETKYQLSAGRLSFQVKVAEQDQAVRSLRLLVPLLESDGEAHAQITLEENAARVTYRGSLYTVGFAPTATALLAEYAANRNGIYHLLRIEQKGAEAEVNLELAPLVH